MVGENLQMNLKCVQSASDSSSSAQQPIVKKETMDVSTTDIVKDGTVLGNSSNNLGELSNPASNFIADAVAPSLTLDSLSSVVEEAEIPTQEESTESGGASEHELVFAEVTLLKFMQVQCE